jgi:phosphoglycerate dehydrogenase-like enzyme
LGRDWHAAQKNLDDRKLYRPFGAELEGRKLGLIGFGASGRELARRASVFGMSVSAIDIREISAEERQEFGLEFAGKPKDMDRVLSESDYVSLHLHVNPQTRHIMDEAKFRLMKPTACLINVARGALVDERALYTALTEGRLRGAGLDVYGEEPVDPNNPILNLPNVVSTPHIAGTTDGTSRRRAATAAENCDRIAAGLEPLYRVDLPS